MKGKLFFAMLFFAFSSAAFAQVGTVQQGDQTEIYTRKDVGVVNPAQVQYEIHFATGLYRPETKTISSGERCNPDGSIGVAVGLDGNRVLVRLTQRGPLTFNESENGRMDPCPGGVLFFMSKAEFLRLKAEQQRDRNKQEHERAIVRKLLREEQAANNKASKNISASTRKP